MDNKTLTETDLQEAVQKTAFKSNIILDSQLLSCIMTCGRLFDFRFNMNLQSIGGKSNSLECGSILHKYMEVMNLALIKGASKSQAHGFGVVAAEMYIHGCKYCTNFVAYHDETTHTNTGNCGTLCIPKPPCNHQVNEYEGVKNVPSDSEGYRIGWKYVLQTIEEYNDYYKNDYWVPLEVETVKSKLIYEDDEIRILWKAKLDLLCDTNDGIFPVDHKTMKQNRKSTNLNNQFMGQCVVSGTRAMYLNKVGWQKTLPPNEKFTRAKISYTNERLMEWQSITVPYWAKMLLMYTETGFWPENYSNCDGKYGSCSFRDVCESNPEMREEELKNNFIIGQKWNPVSANDEE